MEFFILNEFLIFSSVFIFYIMIQYLKQLFNNRNYLNVLSKATVLYKESNFKFNFIFYKIEIFLFLLGIFYLVIQNPIVLFSSLNGFILSSRFFYFLFSFFIFINIIFMLYLIILKDLIYYFEYLIICLIINIFVYVIFFTTDLFILYIAFEGISICSYILISINYSTLRANDINIKYYILSSIFSILFLFDLLIIYLNCGTLDINIITILFSEPSYSYTKIIQIFIVFILMCFTLMFKLGLFPFHFWIVQIYKKMSLINLIYFTIILKYIYIIMFYKIILYLFFTYFEMFTLLNIFISLISILIAGLNGIRTNYMREIIAYSSILNMGFISLSFTPFTTLNILSGCCYLFIYMLLMLFFYYLFIKLKMNKIYMFEKITDLNILIKNSSLYTFLFTIIFLGLAGIPPFIGFFYKFMLLFANIITIQQNQIIIFDFLFSLVSKSISYNNNILMIVILLVNIISSFIYLRVITHLFFYQKESYKNLKLQVYLSDLLIICFFCFILICGFYTYKELFIYLYKIILLDYYIK